MSSPTAAATAVSPEPAGGAGDGQTVPDWPAPAWLAAARWTLRPIALMESLHRRYGDVFSFRLPGLGQLVMVAHPDLVKEAFAASGKLLHAGEPARLLRPVVGPSSVLVLDEEPHMRQRKLLLAPFHGERVGRYESMIALIAREQISAWPRDEPLRLHPRMQAITLEAIVRIVFGAEEESARRPLRRALGELMNETGRHPALQFPALRRNVGPWRPWERFGQMVAAVDELVYEQIAARRASAHPHDDVLSMLIAARYEDGSAMSDAEIRDELITVLTAGHETTATALAWAFELLFRHPDDAQRLAQEACDGDGHDFVDAVVRESLRLRPVIPIVARKATRSWRLGDWHVPAGSIVAPAIYLIHRRSDIYPDPYAFRPDRFLGRAPGTYTWLPFGGGRRRCIGAAFAQLEMRVVLQEAYRALALAPAGPPQHFARRSITIAPSHGTPAIARASVHAPKPSHRAA